MGFISWKCSVSNKTIANINSILPGEYSNCYLVTPKKTYHEQYYYGYGRFDGIDVYELIGREVIGEEKYKTIEADQIRRLGIKAISDNKAPFDIKIVLASEYKGQSYDALKKSEVCEYDGYFYDADFFRSIGWGDQICNECDNFKENCSCNDYCDDCGEHIVNCTCSF